MGQIKKFFKTPGISCSTRDILTSKLNSSSDSRVIKILQTELCFYVQFDGKDLVEEDELTLSWILSTPFQEDNFTAESRIKENKNEIMVEIGPRLNFCTPFSTNAVSICHSVGLKHINRIEYSTRYLISVHDDKPASIQQITHIVDLLHDRMTQCHYARPLESFELQVKSDPVFEVDMMERGKVALEEVNKELGLAFDDWDLDYYTDLFLTKVKRNPTSVECFDLAQSNSEHSRHWFFKGQLIVDGVKHDASLFSLIMDTQNHSNPNNIIKFNDNSSGIVGHTVKVLVPESPVAPSRIQVKENGSRHIIFTAETHNFPTGVAPFPGATTGTGGRIRDVHATGRGAHVLAATAGYMFGNLSIPGYRQPWEDELKYPNNFASPLEIAVEASNGASDYGNKFGEPVLAGFSRSFGQVLASGERREYIKPIMFSAGLGMLDGEHIVKSKPEIGMEVVKIGGPVYRIGVGGGAASSVKVQGDNKAELDFGAVQRGDAEMEQKLNRLIRGCIEMSSANPIQSIHDQGAGGNGNVLKEIVEPVGAVVRVEDFQLGDPTLSILEIWGAEYQESDAILVEKKDGDVLRKLSHRERCPANFVGTVDGSGRMKLEGFKEHNNSNGLPSARLPYDLDLECVLGKMPRKEFILNNVKPVLKDIDIPNTVSVLDALKRVLRLPSVASKRYLTNKVDRSVTGLVAQQQCVGPLHTPLADVAVTASSYFDKVGAATAIGEQPIKGLVNQAAGARMSVAEAITNLMFARVTDLKDVKCSGNWMWAAKLAGEGAALYTACQAMCDVMKNLGIAVDGGKDSLSMAARVDDETVKAPGTLVISVYAPCPDITATVTPDLKLPNNTGCLLYIKLSKDKYRLGGTALAQCYKQIGNITPDLDIPQELVVMFNITQSLLKDRLLTAGHDVSDGGLVTCLLEMAFAGNCGLNVNLTVPNKNESNLAVLFAEEVGIVLEVKHEDSQEIMNRFSASNIVCTNIGSSIPNKQVGRFYYIFL
ncbi:phosphoribosylformylglycinamidine synthase [Patella vulgata]|uniref:phosphoribosylformylglycinamidine synthase n=1 Tax=Patella vulgata TaxID=6465 RepID=UPI00217F39D4|nr:phosphoribosylformylglycinamidine synthase [Patella vulgata]